jgi:hypothetical protein
LKKAKKEKEKEKEKETAEVCFSFLS